MPTSIGWTDADGLTSLTNDKPSPGDRFTGWEPRSVPYGSSGNALEGSLYVFEDREDHSASFSLTAIPYEMLDLCLRLQSHLMGGGKVTIETGDSLGSRYFNCCVVEGSDVTLELSDKEMLEYTMSFNLLNADSERVKMVCVY